MSRPSIFLGLVLATSPVALFAQLDLDRAPIAYFESEPRDPVAALASRIRSGEIRLSHDKTRGYLPALLEALKISPRSQGLVYSKTSFQFRRISPSRPRAIYFNDDVYIGWVPRTGLVEISAVDPRQGAIFYTLSQQKTETPRFERRTHECLSCHGSALTRSVPGHLVRSVYPDRDGQPILRAGTHVSDHTSPLEERWGGWYVTGTHGSARHLGNTTLVDSHDPDDLDLESGANLTDLSTRFDTSPYLTPHSDIVALMVLEHQTQAQNLITRASYLARVALHDDEVLRAMLDEPRDRPLAASTRRRLQNAAEPLVRYLLFCGEPPLDSDVRGTSGFRSTFEALGPRDEAGRSLRDLDLVTRLFRYPLSYTIYSEAFDALPDEVRSIVFTRLAEILSGDRREERFKHLSKRDRRQILEILRATKPGLPAALRGETAPGAAGS